MRWSERQRALLRELGVAPWPERAAQAGPAVRRSALGAEAASTPPPVDAAPSAPRAPRLPSAREPGPAKAVVAAAPGAAAAAADPIATLDWTALRAAVASCRRCALCETRTQTVFGVGHPEARWMVVGEAPGEQEDRVGEPFVGPAGQLLDAMLRALGLTRSAAPVAESGVPVDRRVYIANTLKCRPPRNRNPTPAELLECEPYLVRQIALVAPRIVLAMGRFAVQTLLRSSEPVGRLRGREHRYQGVPLVVTYHPAYLLRNPADKARAWEDLCLAAAIAEREGVSLR